MATRRDAVSLTHDGPPSSSSIVANELAHTLKAQRRGLHVADITLYVFGGAMRMSDEAIRPIDELARIVSA